MLKVAEKTKGDLSTGKPGDSLPVKRKPEKLIQLKRKVCPRVLCISVIHCRNVIHVQLSRANKALILRKRSTL